MEQKLKVTLVTHTPNPLKTIAMAAKLCYSKVGVDKINENMSDDDAKKFMEMLLSYGHLSPLEHASFTFAIEGVSRTLTHQLVRHRLASYSQQSQRYVNENQFEYIIPPSIKEDEEALEEFNKSMKDIQSSYDNIRDILTKNHTEKLVKAGLDEKQARSKALKLANEDARFVLPGACESKIMVTMNVRELKHFFALRTCNRAQWEIRAMATEMLKLAKEVSPLLFKDAGPGCVRGNCTEGTMTCGKAKEVREVFENL